MSTSVERLLPEWRAQPSSYMNKLLSVFKKGEHVNDITIQNKKDHIIFGRKKETCDVVLEHQSISRQHAVLFFGEMGAVYLMDLGSSHGTHIDNEPVAANSPVLLTPQHKIVFGQSSRSYKLCSVPKKPAVPLFTGKNAFAEGGENTHLSLPPPPPPSAPLSSTERQQQERQQREKEIAAFAQEMSSTVPIFENSVQVNASNRDALNKARAQAQADEDGATLEFDNNDDDNDDTHDVDIDELEEVSDSDEEPEAKDTPSGSKSSTAQIKNKGTEREETAASDSKESVGNELETFSLERKIPISHQIDLRGHTKAIACLSCEAAGNRIVTGSMDYSVKLYDFGGMDMRHRAFKAVEVQDGYPLAALAHTPSGDKFIACTGSCQPKVYTRDGEEIITFVRGDMYLRDLSNTKVRYGAAAMLCCMIEQSFI